MQLLVQEQALQLAQDSLDFQHYFVEYCCPHLNEAIIQPSQCNERDVELVEMFRIQMMCKAMTMIRQDLRLS